MAYCVGLAGYTLQYLFGVSIGQTDSLSDVGWIFP
jgi:hypothetical protein